MTKAKRTVFEKAIRTSYANIGWEPSDVRRFRPEWDEPKARAFLEHVEQRLAATTLMAGWAAMDALIDFEKRAPAARMALPTWEHYAPVLVTAGTVADERPRATYPITGWWMDGAFTKRSVQFG